MFLYKHLNYFRLLQLKIESKVCFCKIMTEAAEIQG